MQVNIDALRWMTCYHGFRGSAERVAFVEDETRSVRQYGKIQLMFSLLDQGWEPSFAPVLAPLDFDDTVLKQFLVANLNRSRSYWIAMCQSSQIFLKGPVRAIRHDMPEHYYQCLLQLKIEPLAELMAIENLHLQSDGFFKTFLKGGDLEPLVAIEDLEEEPMEGDPALLDLEHEVAAHMHALVHGHPPGLGGGGGAPGGAHADGVSVLGPVPLIPINREVRVTTSRPGAVEIVVRFDNCSGVGGYQRAITKCPCTAASHHGCAKHRQVRMFPTETRLLAWMHAWASFAKPGNARPEHKYHEPDERLVDDTEKDLRVV